MKKTIRIFILALLTAWMAPSCDIIEEPYLVQVDDEGPGPGDKVRKVLLEDYTGHKCPNCPDAAEVAHNLQELYGEQLVLIAIHAGTLAVPDAQGDFTADYRTTEGNEFFTYFGFPGVPMGMVSRTEFDGSKIMFKDSWEAAVEAQLELDAQAWIEIANNYNSGTRKLDCTIETEFLENLDGTYNICVFLVESGIISPQQTMGSIIPDYVHNHVLRTSLNGTWGAPVGTDGLAVTGSTQTNTYSLTLPAEWNADNCAVVAFVYDSETLVVIQAAETEI